MLFLLSPAKKLDYDSPVRTTQSSQPLFVDEAQVLNGIMQEKTPQKFPRSCALAMTWPS